MEIKLKQRNKWNMRNGEDGIGGKTPNNYRWCDNEASNLWRMIDKIFKPFLIWAINVGQLLNYCPNFNKNCGMLEIMLH